MTDNLRPDVFISYSSKNKDIADEIVKEFESNNIKCWYAPRDIMPGEEWVTAITGGLESSKVLVLIYTDESNESRQVMNEVAVAFNAGKTIVPFRLTENKMNSEFEYYLTRVHWLDGVTKTLADNIVELRKYIEIILSGIDKADTTPGVTNEVKPSKKKKVISAAVIALIAALAGVLVLAVLIVGAIIILSLGSGDRNMKKGLEAYNSKYHSTADNDTARSYFEKAAKKGKEDAYYYLGMLDEREYDYASAKTNYEKGVNEGSNLSKLELGYLYETGRGVYPDLQKAKSYYDEALSAGSIEANFYEGAFLLRGYYGDDIDFKNALIYLNKSKDSEIQIVSADSYFLMGDIYVSDISGADFDYEKALGSYQKTIEKDPYFEGKSYQRMAEVYLVNGENELSDEYYQKALKFFTSSANEGDQYSSIFAGYFYQMGYGTTPDSEVAMDYYRKAADAGNTDAMCYVGYMYQFGQDFVKKDIDKTYEWYKRAADLGNPDAMINIGNMYFKGIYGSKGDEPDYNMARYWYEEGLKNGCIDAYYNLGVMYEFGYGADSDIDKALEYFQKSAEYGYSEAMCEIGVLYENGYIDGINHPEEAMNWYKKAAKTGSAEAMYRIGIMYENAGNYENAKVWYSYAASNGDVNSMIDLAYLFYYGSFGEVDYENAFLWFQKAANAGSSTALEMLGNMYMEGMGTEQSYEKAKRCFEQEIVNGVASDDTYYSLGYMYQKGLGVEADVNIAVEYYKKAADLGNTKALEILGGMYFDGDGVDPDQSEAFYYLQKAADSSSSCTALTYRKLGDCYYYGYGSNYNELTAQKYYLMASDMGLDDPVMLNNIALIYYNNLRYGDAAKYYVKSAEKSKDPIAMYSAAVCFYNDDNYSEALKWFGKSIDSGYSRPSVPKNDIKNMVNAGLVSEEDAKKWLD